MIEFSNVSKRYGASTNALDHMNLTISENGIYCLLGKNGAGKTTLMKLLSGYIEANEGCIRIDGKDVTPSHMPEGVNFIESGSSQFNMKISDLIETANNLQDDFDKKFALKMVKQFHLSPSKKYKALSFGMKTMLTTILTLANNSRVILLDEPILGFDAIMREQFNTLLLESYQNKPRVIIVSTHLIDEIAKIAERLIVINDGKILVHTNIDDIDEHAYTLTGLTTTVEPLLANVNCISKNQIGSMTVAHVYDDRISLPDGVTLERLQLQDFFISIVGGNKYE